MTRAGIWGVREATGLTDLAGQTRAHGQGRALALRRVSLPGAVDRGVERTRGGPSRNRLIAWESTGGQPRLAWPPACLLTSPPRGEQRGNERTVARPVRGQVYPPGGDQDEAQCDSQLRPSPFLKHYRCREKLHRKCSGWVCVWEAARDVRGCCILYNRHIGNYGRPVLRLGRLITSLTGSAHCTSATGENRRHNRC